MVLENTGVPKYLGRIALGETKGNAMKRYWITPLTMGAFVLTGVTGLLMLFKVRSGLVTPVHEWLSLALVIGGVLHVIDHWTGIRKHLDGKWGKGFVAGALVLIALAVWPWSAGEEHERRSNPAEVILAKATVAQLAVISGATTESVIAGLERAGAKDVAAERTIGAVAEASGRPVGRLLASVLRGSAQAPGDDD